METCQTYQLKEKDKATFYSHTNEWIMPAASTIKPEEREFVADSGASMHLASQRDLRFADLETMKIWKYPMTVMTANGEVQTREEATVYVREVDLFVTVMFLEETPSFLSLGNLCEDHGYTYHWTSGQKPHLTKKGKIINCYMANYVPVVVPCLSTSSSTSSSLVPSTSSSQDTVGSTENPATERSEILSEEVRRNPNIRHTSIYRQTTGHQSQRNGRKVDSAVRVEDSCSRELPSCRGSSQWNNGIGDTTSGFGVEDDSNTGEAGERELVLVLIVQ